MTPDEATETLTELGLHLLEFLTLDMGIPNAGEFSFEDDQGEPFLQIELHAPDGGQREGPPHNYGTLYVKVQDHPWWQGTGFGDLVHLRIDDPQEVVDYLESVIAGPAYYRDSIDPALRRLLRQVEAGDRRGDAWLDTPRSQAIACLSHEFGRLAATDLAGVIEIKSPPTGPRPDVPYHVRFVRVGLAGGVPLEPQVNAAAPAPAWIDAQRLFELVEQAGAWLARPDVWPTLGAWKLRSGDGAASYWACLLASLRDPDGEQSAGVLFIDNLAAACCDACEQLLESSTGADNLDRDC